MPSSPKVAILTAHGQPSAPEPAEIALAKLAQRVSLHLPSWRIKSATLAQPKLLEEVMEDGAVVYPFFMAKGWFTANVLPKRLDGFSYEMAAPFGLDPQLVTLAAASLQVELQKPTCTSDVLLAAHGSARGPKAAESTEAFADLLAATLPDATIRIGYIEQPPFLNVAARNLPKNSLCMPFFAQTGDHVRDDIPAALRDAKFHGTLLPALGAAPQVPALIARALETTRPSTRATNTR